MKTHRAEARRWSVGRQGLAVLAAGAGLGAAIDAEGAVIYTDIPDVVVQNGSVPINLNGDAITDFTLADPQLIVLSGPATSQVMGSTAFGAKAFALSPGFPIGPAEPFIGLPAEAFVPFWGDGTDAYLGLEFDISGSTHFGWAHIQTSYPSSGDASATLFSYAYCDQPNQGLLAGQTEGACSTGVPLPSSLALLAVGAGAVLALRRRADSAS